MALVAVFEFVRALHLLESVKFFGRAFNGKKGSLDGWKLLKRILQLGHENRAAATGAGVSDGLSDVFQINLGGLIFQVHTEQCRFCLFGEP